MTPLPQPDLNYLQRVLLEMLAIPSPTGFTEPSCAMSPSSSTNLACPSR